MATDLETKCLHSITQLPFDANAEIFRQYPGFKLGVVDSVRYYAQLLLPLMKQLIANGSAQSGWILTAPPMTAQTPAGANLLCRELFDLYMRGPGTYTGKELSLIDLQLDSDSTWADWKDPAKSQDYAKLNLADRMTEHERMSRRLTHNAEFRGRQILFVNDIRVSGAQQQAMQGYFERAGAACVKWLYLIVVDPEIGRREPAIEWQINFAPFEELLRMVSREQIQFTGKCVQRLMSLSIAELDRVLVAMDEGRTKRLLELASLNGFERRKDFQEQMDLVRSYEHR